VNIAIIGTGNVGSALGSSLVRAGHKVTFAGHDAAKVGLVAGTVGAFAAESTATAVAGAEIVVLAVPYGSVPAVAADIAAVAAGKVVIDATNPLKADYSGLATEGGPSGAERIAALLPGAIVAKAFNTLFAGVQGNPTVHGAVLDALYATDDEAAGRAVAELASSIGFRPVLVGPLAAARELESLAWLNIRLQMMNGGAWQTSYVLVAPPASAIAAIAA
jgi:predicted dinucleotide-binding enzyme